MKKFLCIVLTAALLAATWAVPVFAMHEDEEIIILDMSGIPHNTYVDGMHISPDGVLFKYDGLGGDIVIPDGVTQINYNTFRKSAVTSVVIPDSVKIIGAYAFDSCESLESVIMGDGVEVIGDRAFYLCNIKNFRLSSSVKYIGHRAFTYLGTAGSLTLPNTLEFIGEEAFYSTNFTEVTVPGSVKALYKSAFDNCQNLKKVTLSEGVERIDTYAFDYCLNLKEVVLPKSLKYIGDFAFSSCENLEHMTLPGGIEEVGVAAFMDCPSLKSVNIPASLKVISDAMFRDCISLNSLTIPSSVERIERYAFAGTGLTEAILPAGIPYVDEVAFGGVEPLGGPAKSPADGPVIDAGPDFALDGYTLRSYKGSDSVVAIPAGVKHIGSSAFSKNTNIEKIIMPDSVETIGSRAFWGCTNLASINLPENLKSIGEMAFCNTDSLSCTLKLPASLEYIGQHAFLNIIWVKDYYEGWVSRTPEGQMDQGFAKDKTSLMSFEGYTGSIGEYHVITHGDAFASLGKAPEKPAPVVIPQPEIPAITDVTAKFADVPASAWYGPFLQKAFDSGIVGGMSADKFGPDSNLTNAQIMVMVANLHALQKGEKPDYTKLGDGSHWASGFRNYCKAEGIIDGRFDARMDAKVNRGEMAYYFANAISAESYAGNSEANFSDVDANAYAADIEKLAKAGIVGGFADGTFRAGELVTRAQSCVFVSNIIDAIK